MLGEAHTIIAGCNQAVKDLEKWFGPVYLPTSSASETLSQSESVLKSPEDASPELILLRSALCASSGFNNPAVWLPGTLPETPPSL